MSPLQETAARATHALIVKPGSLGDIVHTLPAIAALHRAHPHLQLHWIIDPRWAALLQGNPCLAKERPLLHFPRTAMRGLSAPTGIRNFLKNLRALPKPDLVLDFQGLLRSGLIAKASGAPIRAGLSDSREGARHFHTHITKIDPGAHAIDRYLALAKSFGANTSHLDYHLPEADISEFPIPNSKFLLLHPYARGTGKALSPKQIINLCQQLSEQKILLIGHPTTPPKNLPPNVTNLTGKTTLPQLITLAKRATLTISADSGPMHIAAAVSPAILSIHTWTDPRKVGPHRPDALLWKTHRIAKLHEFSNKELTSTATLTDLAITKIANTAKAYLT